MQGRRFPCFTPGRERPDGLEACDVGRIEDALGGVVTAVQQIEPVLGPIRRGDQRYAHSLAGLPAHAVLLLDRRSGSSLGVGKLRSQPYVSRREACPDGWLSGKTTQPRGQDGQRKDEGSATA